MHFVRASLVLFLLVAPALRAQIGRNDTLVDSFGAIYCNELLSRLDHFASEVSREGTAEGWAVLLPGPNPFENAAYERGIRNNSAFRNFPSHLVQPIWTEGTGSLSIKLIKLPRGSTPPVSRVELSYRVAPIKTRTRFVEGDLEVARIEGTLEYFGSGADCVSTFSVTVLANVLSANSDLAAEIVIFNRSPRRARELSRLLRRSATLDDKISDKRLKIVYRGSGVARNWSSSLSAVEIWLLPRK